MLNNLDEKEKNIKSEIIISSNENEKKGKKKMIKTMNIEGMSCGHCSARVEQVLNDLPGVSAKVDLDAKKAAVETDGSVDEAVLKKTVEEGGYQVVSIE